MKIMMIMMMIIMIKGHLAFLNDDETEDEKHYAADCGEKTDYHALVNIIIITLVNVIIITLVNIIIITSWSMPS